MGCLTGRIGKLMRGASAPTYAVGFLYPQILFSIPMKNPYIFPATIVLASLILGGFYYASEKNKQSSIEWQQTMKLQEKIRLEEKEDKETAAISREKAEAILGQSACSEEAIQSAVDLNKEYCGRGDVVCIKGENMYSKKIYESYYETCLQRKGLK